MLAKPLEKPIDLATIVAVFEGMTAKSTWGTVCNIGAQFVHVKGLSGIIGLGNRISITGENNRQLLGEVISLEDDICTAMMYERTSGVRIGQKAFLHSDLPPRPSDDWVGKVLDHSGRTVEGSQPASGTKSVNLRAMPPKAILRRPLGPRLKTGVSAIDTFLPLCQGQRTGLFAGSGVGKSSLLGALARGSNADINIIALIGERGREVRSFVEDTLGEEGMKKSILFVSTSDESSALRLRTAQLAIATAEHFRDEGSQVLFLCDSLTRYADAHRDVALTAGEVPSLRAYPPSTFGALSALCERTGPGTGENGDITAIFSVLVAGSNMEEPIADMVRGILDGHIILDREIAERGRYPAINLSRSVSRSLPEAATPEQNTILNAARRYVRIYEDSKTLIQAGLYASGSDPEIDKSVEIYPALDQFLGESSGADIEEKFETLKALLGLPELDASEKEPNKA